MIKKALLSLAAALLTLSAYAIPAAPKAQKYVQPDGTTVMVKLHGDEFYHYATTLDGYTIAMNNQKYYVYTEKVNNSLKLTSVVAHDEDVRSATERAFVSKLNTHEIDNEKVESGHRLRARRGLNGTTTKARPFDFSKFHGLLVLVNFNDHAFSRSDANAFYTRMLNEENYTGYTNEDGSTNPYGRCTGSVRDYFSDNSNGEFVPQFDVVGPVKVSNFGINDGNAKSDSIFMAALRMLDPQVDFSQYDNDGNGQIDMIYFIVAGSGSNADEAHPNYLWPYKSNMYWHNLFLDGKRVTTYACSTEYLYSQDYGVLDGIGVICHEFSHVLGLPDLYDTNYSTNGQSHDPGEWEVMAGGSYGNNSRTPVAYSLYDRYALGFANPQVITEVGTYSLQPVSTTGDGYILLTPNAKEKFLLDNRQTSLKWDSSCPGHGMIIARMDSTNSNVWNNNSVNDRASRNYYELLRAGNSKSGDVASDPFPGTKSNTFVSNFTTPNLKAYGNKDNPFSIYRITESNGVITFNIIDASSILIDVEDFEPMPVSDNLTESAVMGTLTNWDFNQCHVAQVSGANTGDGNRSVAMVYPSALTTHSPLNYETYRIEFDVYNPTSASAKFTCKSSADGSKWSSTLKLAGDATNTVAPGTKSTLAYTVNYNTPMYYRINQTGGDKTNPCYIDDFRIYYNEVEVLRGDVNGDGEVNTGDISEIYSVILGIRMTNMSRADINGDDRVNTGDISELYGIILGTGAPAPRRF